MGPLTSGGIDMDIALTMSLMERDDTLGDRKLELIAADTASVPKGCSSEDSGLFARLSAGK
jgi:hypothetical protein